MAGFDIPQFYERCLVQILSKTNGIGQHISTHCFNNLERKQTRNEQMNMMFKYSNLKRHL